MKIGRFVGPLWLFCLSMLLALGGCAKPDDAKTGEDAGKEAVAGSSESVDKGGENPSGPALSSVPAGLKHDGYAYYGLDNPSPIQYEVVSSALPEIDTGSATTKLTAVEGEIARFVTTRTGTALAQMGDEEVEARKDGIYYTKIGGHPVEPAQLVLPAELPAGKAWNTKGKVTAQTAQGVKTFDQSFKYKVAGVEKVKTKAGEFDAIKILANGEITLDGKKNQSEIAAWYVKGLGTVRMAITATGPQKVTMTIEATKVP